MQNGIIKEIINEIRNSRLSTKNISRHIQVRFEDEVLFKAINEYMNQYSLNRREWITFINILCQINDKKAKDRLIQALDTKDPDKRFRVVKAVGFYKIKEVVEKLLFMLKEDPDPSIRFQVAYSLGLIGDKQAISSLQWSIDNDYDTNYEGTFVSHAAKEALDLLVNEKT